MIYAHQHTCRWTDDLASFPGLHPASHRTASDRKLGECLWTRLQRILQARLQHKWSEMVGKKKKMQLQMYPKGFLFQISPCSSNFSVKLQDKLHNQKAGFKAYKLIRINDTKLWLCSVISWWDSEQFCEQQFFILTTCVHGSFARLGCTAFFSWFTAWMVTHIFALLGLWSRRGVAELFFRVIPFGKFHLQLLRKPNREKQSLRE